MNRPNIVFILIDDLGWKDLACYGSSFYEAPHIDRLAREGMRFTDAYAACPVCSPTRNAPLAEGKGWMYEGGTREPLLVRWPGRIAPRSTCSVPVTSPDFYPTILELAGLAPRPAQHCDGVSIAPLLHGAKSIEREAIFWHYPHYGNQGGTPGSSVRAGDYKLIEFFADGRLELYNLRDDVGEERNLAEHLPQTRDRLHALLRAGAKRWKPKSRSRIPITKTEIASYECSVSTTSPMDAERVRKNGLGRRLSPREPTRVDQRRNPRNDPTKQCARDSGLSGG